MNPGQGIAGLDVGELRRLRSRATEGDWKVMKQGRDGFMVVTSDSQKGLYCSIPNDEETGHDAKYIAAIHNALPALLERLETLTAERVRMRNNVGALAEGYLTPDEFVKRVCAALEPHPEADDE